MVVPIHLESCCLQLPSVHMGHQFLQIVALSNVSIFHLTRTGVFLSPTDSNIYFDGRLKTFLHKMPHSNFSSPAQPYVIWNF